MPMIQEIWSCEQIPAEWNKGTITTIWKGKGDRECLSNHRGITVSSAVGSILEEVIDKRMEKIVNFTPGQAGGVKGASTADHLFLLRGIMTTAREDKSNVFLTFYDVCKAYDNADVDNMLHVMWEAGVKGKMWRILRKLSKDLTAVVKTRYGPSRPIIRENGGKQGSKAMGRKFAKQMDTLSEEFISEPEKNYQITNEFSIGCLEWIDDVMTATTGKINQVSILNTVDEFAQKNKLEWGAAKCQVMQVGQKVKVPTEWNLGEKRIKNTSSYKYLVGDIVTDNNSNKTNLEARENKAYATVRHINTTASSDIMRGIEAKVLLILYEKSIIPSLTYNCESWTLSPSEEKQVDQIGIRALKRLFGLPTTTPNSAVIHNLGQLYMTQEIDKKRLMFLHKIITRNTDHWTNKMLRHLQERDLGWAKNIKKKIDEYKLETDWKKISEMTKNQWKIKVNEAIEKANMKKLMNACTKNTPDGVVICTKTKYIHQTLSNTTIVYQRNPQKEIVMGNKERAKSIIISRNRMLDCGTNYKGTMSQACRTCKTLDNEDHRLNDCLVYKENNLVNYLEKCKFDDIYSDNVEILNPILTHIEKLWEFRFANGRMKKV